MCSSGLCHAFSPLWGLALGVSGTYHSQCSISTLVWWSADLKLHALSHVGDIKLRTQADEVNYAPVIFKGERCLFFNCTFDSESGLLTWCSLYPALALLCENFRNQLKLLWRRIRYSKTLSGKFWKSGYLWIAFVVGDHCFCRLSDKQKVSNLQRTYIQEPLELEMHVGALARQSALRLLHLHALLSYLSMHEDTQPST